MKSAKAYVIIPLMPILKNAIKKLRVDKRRAAVNRPIKSKMKSAMKVARANPTKENMSKLHSALDLAVKKGVAKRNMAARVKSRISKVAKTLSA